MTRIPLTDADIWVSTKHKHEEEVIIQPDDSSKEKCKQLKKQILDDYEFADKFRDKDIALIGSKGFKELKEKDEKWDDAHMDLGAEQITKLANSAVELKNQNIGLKQENKQLKAKWIAEKGFFPTIAEAKKNKEIVQKIKEPLIQELFKDILESMEKSYEQMLKPTYLKSQAKKKIELFKQILGDK